MLVTLSPDREAEYLTALTLAWSWTQARPRAYPDTGGNQTLAEYLAEATQDDRKQLAIVSEGKIASLLTVRLAASGTYEIHVTSPARTRRQVILDALLIVRESLLHDLKAKRIVTSCPIYDGHEHKGSRRLAEACGMIPNDVEWQSVNDETVLWREYELRRT